MNPLEELVRILFEALGDIVLAILEGLKALVLFPIINFSSAISLIILVIAFFVGFIVPSRYLPIDKLGIGSANDLDDGLFINLGRYLIALVFYGIQFLCGFIMVIITHYVLSFIGLL